MINIFDANCSMCGDPLSEGEVITCDDCIRLMKDIYEVEELDAD